MKYFYTQEIEALTFDEFIKFGLEFPGVNIIEGVPWSYENKSKDARPLSFEINGVQVTYEADDSYVIASSFLRFKRGHILLLEAPGQLRCSRLRRLNRHSGLEC